MSGPTAVRTVGFDELAPRTAYAVWRLRQEVFVVEQDCPYLDLDGRDTEPATRHVLLEQQPTSGQTGGPTGSPTDDPSLLGYARVLDDGDGWWRVGRVLLDRRARGRGLADVVLGAALAETGDRPVRLDAQAPLARWYAGFGFEVTGPEFLEDGIPHLPMARR